MLKSIKIALCQLNLTTGDFEGNYRKAEKAVRENEADIYVFPECQASNYPSDDLFLHEAYLKDSEAAALRYKGLSATTGKTLVFGAAAGMTDGKTENSVAVARDGQPVRYYAKTHLPNYGVFDDVRWFSPGSGNDDPYLHQTRDGGIKIGFCVCEDIWFDDVTGALAKNGAEILVSINSSPYSIAKAAFRRNIFMERVTETRIPLIYVNQVGGNDELLWDGCSAVMDPDGNFHEAQPWAETVDVVTLSKGEKGWRLVNGKAPVVQAFDAERYVAACTGLRDYVGKTGFSKVVLGLSGGADSALVGLMAADVFGERNVDFIMMPTDYTSGDSNDFARDLAAGLGAGAKAVTVPVQLIFDVFAASFESAFGETAANVAEENLQAQLRGDILSWFSNKFGSMILSTGNKSELAMGYATLYGDMRGGFNPLKDLYKTEVFELLELRHSHATKGRESFRSLFRAAFGHDPVPLDGKAAQALRGTIDRPPSAELAEGQLDSDSLPDYAVLDKILWEMIDHRESRDNEQVALATGQPLELVEEIRRRLRAMEYKRFQACPGPKIHRKSFTKKDWRFPMASTYRK